MNPMNTCPDSGERGRRSRWLTAGPTITIAALAQIAIVAVLFAAPPFTPNATQPTINFALNHAYANPGNCQSCHGGYDATNDVEPFDLWSGTMMGNSNRDPIFWAALDVANNDVPGSGEFCLRCHAPKAWLEGRASAGDDMGTPTVGDADGCSLQGNIDEGMVGVANDFEGVTCALCHRMMENDSPPPGESNFYIENAEYWIDDEDCGAPGSGPCRRGPYDYGGADPQPPHEWAFSTYHQGSEMCATCHNVTNPLLNLIDENGNDTGILYPVERTYTEWTQSDYGSQSSGSFLTCQNCHMPDSTEDPVYACVFQTTNRTGDLPQHHFVGGNTWIPGILENQYGATIDNGTAFADTTARAQAMLESAALISVMAPTEIEPEGTLEVDVRVTNSLTGHKLPTGYTEGRRMWIHLEVVDALDTVVFESGAYDPVTAVLTKDSQVKIYETIRGTWNPTDDECVHTVNDVEQFHFVLANCILSDNRIPPLGFTGGTDIETQPVAYTYPETSPGSGVLVNYDDTTYTVPIPPGAATPLTVNATLRYQTSSKEYIEFLRDEAINNNFDDDCTPRSSSFTWPGALGVGDRSRGEYLYWLWDNIDKSTPVDMVDHSVQVVIDPTLFADGFESGNTSEWSSTTP